MTTVAIVYHSGYGHTAVVAQEIAAGVSKAGATPVLLKIEGLTQDFGGLVDQASQADAIIFGAPTYMGDVSAPLKAFFEATSKVWGALGWKDKVAGGFTNSLTFAGGKEHALNTIISLAMQHGMIWVGTGLPPGNANGNTTAAPEALNRLNYPAGVAAQSDNAGTDVTPPEGDKATARVYGERIAGIAAKLKG